MAEKKPVGQNDCKAKLQPEQLEQRIMLSASWVDIDADNEKELVGSSSNDILSGTSNGEEILGLDGDDELVGGLGNDLLDGGAGTDTAIFSEVVTVDLNTGTASGSHGDDKLKSIENVEGSDYADDISGGGGANVLKGQAGNDVLDGRGGDDTLIGGEGDDKLIAGGGNDWLKGNDGNDTFDLNAAVAGDLINLGGGDDFDTIDLTRFTSDQVTFADGKLTVATSENASFEVNYANIEQISFSDVTATILDGDVPSHTLTGDHIYLDGDIALYFQLSDNALVRFEYDSAHKTLDLCDYSFDQASFGEDGFVLELGDGETLSVQQSNLSSVHFSDRSLNFLVWDGEANNGDASDAKNWSSDRAPGPNDILVFTDTSSGTAWVQGGTIAGLMVDADYQGVIKLHGDLVISGDMKITNGWMLAEGHNLEVQGDLTLGGGKFELGSGTISVSGDVDFSGGEFHAGGGTLTLQGAGDQTLNADGAELHNLVIRTTGEVTLEGDTTITGNLIAPSSALDASGAKVTFSGHNAVVANNATFGDVILKTSSLTVGGDLDIDGNLTITSLYRLDGGSISVAGWVKTTDTHFSGSATIVLDGAGDQTVHTDGGQGKLQNLTIDKQSGEVIFLGDLTIGGNLTLAAGSLDAEGATVTFRGNNHLDVGGATFGDVVIDGQRLTVAGEMLVEGKLTIQKLLLFKGGWIKFASDLDAPDKTFNGDGMFVATGGSAVIGLNGSKLKFENVEDKAVFVMQNKGMRPFTDLSDFAPGQLKLQANGMMVVDQGDGTSFQINFGKDDANLIENSGYDEGPSSVGALFGGIRQRTGNEILDSENPDRLNRFTQLINTNGYEDGVGGAIAAGLGGNVGLTGNAVLDDEESEDVTIGEEIMINELPTVVTIERTDPVVVTSTDNSVEENDEIKTRMDEIYASIVETDPLALNKADRAEVEEAHDTAVAGIYEMWDGEEELEVLEPDLVVSPEINDEVSDAQVTEGEVLTAINRPLELPKEFEGMRFDDVFHVISEDTVTIGNPSSIAISTLNSEGSQVSNEYEAYRDSIKLGSNSQEDDAVVVNTLESSGHQSGGNDLDPTRFDEYSSGPADSHSGSFVAALWSMIRGRVAEPIKSENTVREMRSEVRK